MPRFGFSMAISPASLRNVHSQFGTNYSSHVLHESRVLRVVDATMPIDNDGAEVEEIMTKTVRRMEFIASPLFAQTGSKPFLGSSNSTLP